MFAALIINPYFHILSVQHILESGNMLSTLSCAKATKYPCPQYYPNINTRGSAQQKLRLCGV